METYKGKDWELLYGNLCPGGRSHEKGRVPAIGSSLTNGGPKAGSGISSWIKQGIQREQKTKESCTSQPISSSYCGLTRWRAWGTEEKPWSPAVQRVGPGCQEACTNLCSAYKPHAAQTVGPQNQRRAPASQHKGQAQGWGSPIQVSEMQGRVDKSRKIQTSPLPSKLRPTVHGRMRPDTSPRFNGQVRGWQQWRYAERATLIQLQK